MHEQLVGPSCIVLTDLLHMVKKLSVLHLCVHTLPEYAVWCGEIKATTICVFNVAHIHLNRCDANSDTIVLDEIKEW